MGEEGSQEDASEAIGCSPAVAGISGALVRIGPMILLRAHQLSGLLGLETQVLREGD